MRFFEVQAAERSGRVEEAGRGCLKGRARLAMWKAGQGSWGKAENGSRVSVKGDGGGDGGSK